MTEAADASKTADQKADAKQGGTVMDAVLSKLDSLHKRMDDIESKGKADTKARGDGDLELEKKEKEAAGENEKVIDKKKDAKADGKRGDEWPDKDKDKDDSKKADAKRKDEFPPKDEDEDEDKKKNPFGDKKDSKADAKRSDRDKDEDTTASNVAKGDGKGRRDSPDWDEQEKEISKGDARADAYVRVKASDWENVTQRLSAIDQFVNRSDEDRAKFAEVQERADAIYGAHSKRAPANLPGEALADYRRRLVTPFRQYSKDWSDVKMSELGERAFDNVEKVIYADALRAAESPSDLGPGELRRRDVVDPETRVHRIEWVGNESFIKALSQEPRRVSGFRSRHTG